MAFERQARVFDEARGLESLSITEYNHVFVILRHHVVSRLPLCSFREGVILLRVVASGNHYDHVQFE